MRDDSGQIHTIEGITAALILLVVLLFVTQSITFVAPQTEKSVDMNLSIMASDALITLNTGNEFHPSELKAAISAWNNHTVAPGGGVDPAEASMMKIDAAIRANLSHNINYELSLYYNESGTWVNKTVISHGAPSSGSNSNAMTAFKPVTLTVYDDQYIPRSAYWEDSTRKGHMPTVVVVRLSLWYA